MENSTLQFENYCQKLVTSKNTFKTLSTKQLENIFYIVEEFEIEVEKSNEALKGLDLYKLAVGNDNKLEEYKKSNKLAEVYLEKLESFYTITLPNFLDAFCEMIYAN